MVSSAAPSVHIACPHCLAVNRVPSARLEDGPRCGTCHEPLLEGRPVALDDDARFQAVIGRTDLPVLVDFWAAWCGPCRAMAPAFERAASDFGTRARFGKLDTERLPAVAQRYGIRSIPTLILFRGGREVDRVSGALDAGSLARWLEPRLNH